MKLEEALKIAKIKGCKIKTLESPFYVYYDKKENKYKIRIDFINNSCMVSDFDLNKEEHQSLYSEDWIIVRIDYNKEMQEKIDAIKFSIIRHCHIYEYDNNCNNCKLYKPCRCSGKHSRPTRFMLDDWNLHDIFEMHKILEEES